MAWHPSRGCTLGVEALSRSSWSYQRLASLTAVQGLCQAPTTRGGMRQSVLSRAGGERGGRRDSGLSGASFIWCQGHTASPLAACPHVGTARGGLAREGSTSSRAGAGEPSLRSRELCGATVLQHQLLTFQGTWDLDKLEDQVQQVLTEEE